MTLPATRPPSPPLFPPASAAEARDGFAPAEGTPLHLRAAADALLLPDERGAVELEKTDCPPCRVTPAVAPLTREARAA